MNFQRIRGIDQETNNVVETSQLPKDSTADSSPREDASSEADMGLPHKHPSEDPTILVMQYSGGFRFLQRSRHTQFRKGG